MCTASHPLKHLYSITPTKTSVQHHTSNNICTSHQQKHLYNTTLVDTSVQHHTSKYIYNVILGKTSVGQQHMSRSVSTTPHQEKPCTASHKVVSLSTYCSCIILHPELPYILLCTEIFLWYFHKKGKTGVSLSWYISTCAGTNYIRWHSSVIIEECFFNRHYKLMSSHKSLVFHQTTLLNLLQIINKPTENNNKQGHHRFPPIVIEITWSS